MISKELLGKFKKLYKDKYDVNLSDEQTTQLANDLVNIMRVLLKPEPKIVSNEAQQEERRIHEVV